MTKAQWPEVALEGVADLNPRLPEKLTATDQVAFVPMASVSAETARVTVEETRAYSEVAKGYTSFLSGDVLLAKITPCFENGKIAQALLSKRVGFGSTEFHVIRPHADKLDGRYTHHFLRLDSVRLAGERRMTGSGGQRRVPENYLAKLAIPLPPLAEQRRIAEVLDRAEALRAKRRAALAQLDALTQSLFLDLFGDPRKKSSTGNTPTKPRLLGDLTRIRTGKLDANAADADGAHPFFTCAVEPLRINTPAFDCKAVLVAGSGDLNVKYFEGKFNAYQRTYVIECLDESVLVPKFLYAFLDLYVSELRKQAIGGVIKYIKLPYLTDAVVQLPTDEWQREFARRVTAVESLKTAQRASLAELDALFATLQHRAFRGEL